MVLTGRSAALAQQIERLIGFCHETFPLRTENVRSIELAANVRDNEGTMNTNTRPINILDVIRRIEKLAEFREKYLHLNQRPPPFQFATERLGVSGEEVHIYSPELYMQWYDENFHCKLPEEHPFH